MVLRMPEGRLGGILVPMTQADIRPFRIEVPGPALDDLAERIDATRWPAPHSGPAWSRGVPLDYLRRIAAYWRGGYRWRDQEARLNAFPQFTTVIDGQDVHFVHLRSPR